jgi:DNA mismatch endonuclease (patch repair protein)
MADVVGKETRSRMMSNIRGKDTKPELIVRRGLHRRGLRFRIHDRRLAGRPDLYFPRFKAAIFVNGCFWHRHDCEYFKWPSNRAEFWRGKLEGNTRRDADKIRQLAAAGVRVLVIWECALRSKDQGSIERVISKAEHWLKSESGNRQISGHVDEYNR